MVTKEKLKTIKQLGKQVRNRIKLFNKEILSYELCRNYNLSGGCLMASYMLQYVLKNHDIKADLISGHYHGSYHWWVTVDDTIVDLTITQFGVKNKVYITSNNTGYKVGRYQSKKFGGWPKRLRPPQYEQYFNDI